MWRSYVLFQKYFLFLVEEYIVIKANNYSIDKLQIRLLRYVRNDKKEKILHC